MTRAAIVAEALTWVGTPFHHAARCKGAGVDCANLLIGVFAAVGLVPDIALEYYPQDWHMHRDETRFLSILGQYADPLENGSLILPGDIVMFNYGRHAAHGAIVTAWPVVCHAWADVGSVVLTEANTGPLADRVAGVYRLRGLAV
jgi:cell wall-associated NlpC family hydrolase